jgi:hypothetical protein
MKIKYFIILVCAITFVFNANAQTKTTSSKTNVGTVEVEILSKQPFTFQLKRLNNKKTAVWTSTHSLDENIQLRNIQASVLPNMNIKVVGEVETSARRDNDVVIIHFDDKGNLLWNSTLGNDAKLEVINSIDDGNNSTFLNVKADSETQNDVYVIVCFGPDGGTTFTTSYASNNDALTKSKMEMKGDLLEVKLTRNQSTDTYVIDKKKGNIKSAPKTDASNGSSIVNTKTAVDLKKGKLNIRKVEGTDIKKK